MTILWPPFVGWMFFCSLLFRILSRTRVIKTLAYLFYAIRPARDAYEIKAIIVIRCFAQSRQQQTDRMKDPFNPLLRIVSESGARRDRIWDETRPHLGRDTTAPGRRHDRTWEEARANLGRGTTERGTAFADRHRSRIGGLPCLQTNGLCKIRQAPTSFTNSKYAQILYSLPYIAI